MNVPDGEIWIIDKKDPRRSVRIYNIDTEYQVYPGADWIHQTGDEDPDTEQTRWQRFCWLLVLGFILTPLALGIAYVLLSIFLALT